MITKNMDDFKDCKPLVSIDVCSFAEKYFKTIKYLQEYYHKYQLFLSTSFIN